MRCLDCDYRLLGLPAGRCPECGRAFDPARFNTWHTRPPTPSWARFWLRPIPWWAGLLALVPIGLSLPIISDPSWLYMRPAYAVFFVIAIGVPIAAIASARDFARSVIRDRYCPHRRLHREHRWRQIALGLVLGVGLLQVSSLLTRVHFLLVAGSFHELRGTTLSGTTKQTNAGLWSITGEWVRVDADRMVFAAYTSGHSFPGGGSGFVWVPDGEPMPGYNRGTDGHVGGGWHYYTTD